MADGIVLPLNCLDGMRSMADSSVDAIVTDPPYGISFMGKRWDYDVPSVAMWAEALRVLKPGGYMLAFASTRTQHRMAVRIEDAGWEIRDMIAWVYGSGMPKHQSSLKPALEPITLARKPAERATLLNIDACRVDTVSATDAATFENNHRVTERLPEHFKGRSLGLHDGGWKQKVGPAVIPPGRYPANLIHDGSDEVLAAFPSAPGQQGDLKETGRPRPSSGRFGDMPPPHAHAARIDRTTSAARFFYCAKASRSERGEGNNHPTVKPIALMRYLCKLVTPTDGLILDLFAGSGSTGVAAKQEGFRFLGFELDAAHAELANGRIRNG